LQCVSDISQYSDKNIKKPGNKTEVRCSGVIGFVILKYYSMKRKYLIFNEVKIYFLDVEGIYWIAYKPIVDALGIDANRSHKNLIKHKIFGPACAIQPMQVSKNGINQVRNMTCIPEKYVYGWLLSLNSENENLLEFQKKCYDLLFDYFRGSFIQREKILEEKAVSLIKQKNLLTQVQIVFLFKEKIQMVQA
jgi:hypothetical protein